jgi:hypothetical protein
MSQLSDSIQRQRAMDIKGHSGLPEIEKRDLMSDRRRPVRKVFQVTADTEKVTKWLKL